MKKFEKCEFIYNFVHLLEILGINQYQRYEQTS